MRIRTIAVALGALALTAVLAAITPADAGFGNYVVVNKVPDGPVPAGTVFEIEVVCSPTNDINNAEAASTGQTTILKYDANGLPLGANKVSANLFETCKVTETVDGGASTVSYRCAVPPPPNGLADPEVNGAPVKCLDDQTVAFGEVTGAEGTVTVTNTFTPEPPPPAPPAPAVVAARPAFTG